MSNVRLIESDDFPFEFLSQVGERESWRKEVHRPVYHLHKWWAKRLGTVFRGILLGCTLQSRDDLAAEFYRVHDFTGVTVLDPFMGSGTTVGEAHKLGLTALGRDINPVAVNSARVAFGPLDRRRVEKSFRELADGIRETILDLYRATDSQGRACDVLYHFWIMQTPCPVCNQTVDLFPTYVFARNADPRRRPRVQVLCPKCGDVFPGTHGQDAAICRECKHQFDPDDGPAKGAKAKCPFCSSSFSILESVKRTRPQYRHYAKLVLTTDQVKHYLPSTVADREAYAACSSRLNDLVAAGRLVLPSLALEHGFNTRQAMSYGFLEWRDFFNDRQLLALALLHSEIAKLSDEIGRAALQTLFSGVLEFNTVFASYKGEGTGAVRHMFAHHILKPERMSIEANVWGTHKSSGSFSSLFRSRLLRAIEYRSAPTEVDGTGIVKARVCSHPFTGKLASWGDTRLRRAIALSCGDSSDTGLPDKSIDLVVTDPPFFDNVHYSELADFFFAWQQLEQGRVGESTRNTREVQDTDSGQFAEKLESVFRECYRVLKDDGLLVFTYHHSRDEGWKSLAQAVLGAGFLVVNSQPVKAEMSVATPKSQAKEPIQLDIIIVCRKSKHVTTCHPALSSEALSTAHRKLQRLNDAGFTLSRSDKRIVLFGQMLTTLTSIGHVDSIVAEVERTSDFLEQLETSPNQSVNHRTSAAARPQSSKATKKHQSTLFE